MTVPLDSFIDIIERRKRQLDDVLDSYREFMNKLHMLPPDIAEEAQRVLRLNSAAVPERVVPLVKDLAGKSALECVRIILQEQGNRPTHYAALAKEAMQRGYKGRAGGTPEEVEHRTVQSFWAAMSRAEDLERAGQGQYRLKRHE
jgi:hypothetical protein